MSKGGAQVQSALSKAADNPAVPEKISQKRRICAVRMADTSNVHAEGHAGRSWRGRGRPLKVSSTVCQSSGRKSVPTTVSSSPESSGSSRILSKDDLWSQAWDTGCTAGGSGGVKHLATYRIKVAPWQLSGWLQSHTNSLPQRGRKYHDKSARDCKNCQIAAF